MWLTGTKVAMVDTRPWYAGPRAEEIDAARRAAETTITTATGANTARPPKTAGEAA